jgi:hypothetical protein
MSTECKKTSSLITHHFLNASSNHLIVPANNQRQRFGIKLMFLLEYARREGFLGVIAEDGNYPLSNDWPTIESFVNEVNRATRPLHPVLKHSGVYIEAGKRRQQTWMNVQNAIAICFDEIIGEQAHVPGETNELDTAFVQCSNDRSIMFFTRTTAAFDGDGLESAIICSLQPCGCCVITDYQRDFRIRYAAFVHGVSQRKHV